MEVLLELVFLSMFLVIVGIFIPITFLSAIARAVRLVTPENRRLQPRQVWFALIPGFNVVWLPILIDRVAESLRNELETRGLAEPRCSYGRAPGLAGIMLAFFAPLFLATDTDLGDFLGFMSLTGVFVCWVVYWIRIMDYRRLLKSRTYVPSANEKW